MVKILTKKEKNEILQLKTKSEYNIDVEILETPRLYLVIFGKDKKETGDFENSVQIMKKKESQSDLKFYLNKFLFKNGDYCGYINISGSFTRQSISATIRSYSQQKGIMTEALHYYYQYLFDNKIKKYHGNFNYSIEHQVNNSKTSSIHFHEKFGSFKENEINGTSKVLVIDSSTFFEEKAFQAREQRIRSYYEKDQDYQNYLKNTPPSENIACDDITNKQHQQKI